MFLGCLERNSEHPSTAICKEVILRNALSHPDILKLAGVHGNMDKGRFTTISDWMAHGNIMQCVWNNHVNRLEPVRGFTAPAIPFTEDSLFLFWRSTGEHPHVQRRPTTRLSHGLWPYNDGPRP